MKIPVPQWFYQIWPFDAERASAINGYRVLAQQRHTMTDIALRGGVFSVPRRVAGDVFGDGIAEGRRQLALEIFEMAKLDPATVWDSIPKRPTGQERN